MSSSSSSATLAGDGSRHNWQIANLCQNKLVFGKPDGLTKALRDGFFFVSDPMSLDLSAGDRFAQNFYLQQRAEDIDPYRGFKRWTSEQLGPREGYYCRNADQTEQFFLESRLWDDIYPRALAKQAAAMKGLALDILEAVLFHLDIPRALWDEATGRCLSGRGTYHLTFNHFRPEIKARGLNTHKDSGWVTVLRSIEPGLEVLRNGEWCPIDPLPNAFIVNFGCAIEILTARCRTPVAAVAHRVVQQNDNRGLTPDRFSYALFVDSSLDESICPGLYRYEPETDNLAISCDFNSFLDEIVKNTYQNETVGLY